MTSDSEADADLLERVRQGDNVAVRQLLLPHVVYLSDFLGAKYPQLKRGMMTVEDVIQETLADAYGQAGKFDPNKASLRTWLTTIAERRACDAIRGQQRIKRGGQHQQVHQAAFAESSVYDIVEMLSAESHTASRSVARHEAVQAIQAGIEQLPEHYRQAVQLHLIEGKSLHEVAATMDRTPRAIQGLIDRAKKKLSTALGRLSRYE